MKFDPIKKVPVYDQHLVKPVTDPLLIRVNEDIFIPLYVSCSEAIQSVYYNKVHMEIGHLAPIMHLYLSVFNKFSRNVHMLAEGVRTMWLVV